MPGEVATTTWEGTPGSRLGQSVALGERLLAGEPGANAVYWPQTGERLEGPEGLGAAVWWAGEAWAGLAGVGVYRLSPLELVLEVPGALGFAADTTQVVILTEWGFLAWDYEDDLQRVEVPGLRRAVPGTGRWLLLSCAQTPCEALSLDEGGETTLLGEAEASSALREIDGEAWWSLPQDATPMGGGRVCRESEATCLEGEPGDHLGRALSDHYAVGVFNKWGVPARARVVPLEGGTVYAVDQAIETRSLALDDDGDHLLVGVPSYAPTDGDTGRLILVPLP